MGIVPTDDLFWELMDQLVRHEVAEEAVVYPALRQEPGGAPIAEARRREEFEAEHVLARLENLDPRTEEFRGAVRDLESAVWDHAQKEAEVFPLLAANEEAGYLTLLGQKFKGEKLASRPSGAAPPLPLGADRFT
jgi:hypothetical protein